MQTALTCLKAVADAYGLPFDPAAAADRLGLGAAEPDLDALLALAAGAGLDARVERLDVPAMAALGRFPLLCVLANGNSVVVLGVRDTPEGLVVRVADPLAQTPGSFEVDRESFEKSHGGVTVVAIDRKSVV